MSAPVTLGTRVRYQFDNFMSRGGLSIFLALLTLFLCAFLVMGAFRVAAVAVVGDAAAGEVGNQLWRTFLQVTDAGAVAEDGESSLAVKAVGIATIGVGLVLFSSLVAFLTSAFEERLAELRKGRSEVVESGHTIVLGFGERTVEILRELIVANESERRAAVVILAEDEKDEMDDLLGERLVQRGTTAVITRSGTPSSLPTLRRMGVDRARAVLILNPASSIADDSEMALGDARVLKTIMAILAVTDGGKPPSVVAELHAERSRELARNLAGEWLTTLDERAILAKLLVQTSRTSGLAVVYADLVGFVGNEIYFHRPASGWRGLSFGQIQLHFAAAMPLGFRTSAGEIVLNPPPDLVPDDSDEAIILAEDDSKIVFLPSPSATPTLSAIPDRRAPVTPERQLLVGWSSKGRTIVEEYVRFLQPGSTVNVLVAATDDTINAEIDALNARFAEIEIAVLEADAGDPDALRSLAPESYNNVILLAPDGASAEEMDAATIATLLAFRQHFRGVEAANGAPVATQLITEVMDSDNATLVLESGVKDFLISNQFVSKVAAQVSQEPGVMAVYDHLFSPEGSEIYIKSAALYFENLPVTVRFADLLKAAQLRNECCFGVKLGAEETNAARNFGVRLLPARDASITLTAADALVVLAEDET
jgi:hypothetical protein